MASLKGPKLLVIIWSIILSLAATLVVGYLVLANNYDDRVYPNIKIANQSVSGLNEDELATTTAQLAKSVMSQNWTFDYQGEKLVVDPMLGQATSVDLARPLIDVDTDKTASQAWIVGRSGNFAVDCFSAWRSLLFSHDINLQYYLDKDNLKKILQDKFSAKEQPLKNASLQAELKADGTISTQSIAEQSGWQIDYDQAISQLEKQLASGNFQDINLENKVVDPQIKLANVPAVGDVSKLVSSSPLELKYQDPASSSPLVVKAEKADLVKWINYLVDNGNITIGFDQAIIASWLQEKVAPLINREPESAKFEIQGTKVSSFQAGANGQKLDVTATAAKIVAALKDNQSAVDLTVNTIADNSVKSDNLGIKEIVGTGHSNFAGSPKNRRHNISVGSAAVNGLLIKPGEEFSLVKALGNVDQTTGYLPELVIKENHTIPEYGGGLCQVGTTLFRAAIESGLPITERHNHSYRVVYYEPAGMDAAVYIPHPDVRFVNDSANYILIQSRINGDDIYFDFWGVKDGRQVDISQPTIYNIVKPAPTKFIYSADLPPGQKKCTEKAHNGADAYFDYKVIYNPGTDKAKTKQQRFSSHYVPWQEVCLIGEIASSTASTTLINSSSSPSTVSTTTHQK